MRTKTLVLTALGSLSALGLMAQTGTNVYSLNAVGYINVTCPPGFSIIADQLFATGGNTLSNILSNVSGQYNLVNIYKWNNNPAGYTSEGGDNQLGDPNTGWDPTLMGQTTLNPGEGAWFQNPNSTNMVLTFVGTVPQGTNTLHLATGFNLVSSIVPQAGDIVTTMGLTNYNVPGDNVYFYSPGAGYVGGTGTEADNLGSGNNGDWSNGDPTVAVGQGFWYQAAAPIAWTRNFSVNN